MSFDPRSFLATVVGAANAATANDSVNRPIKLATIDPDYSGSGAPRVTFDGESTLSSKTYAFLDSYRPGAGDRVALLPVGTTYLIAGHIDDDTAGRPVRTVNIQAFCLSSTGDTANLSTTYQDVPGCSKTFDVVNSTAAALVDGVFWFQNTTNGGANDTMVGSLNVDGTLWVPPEQTSETAAVWRPGTTPPPGNPNATYPQVWKVPLAPGTHTLKLQAKRSGNTGAWICRTPHTAIKILVLDL